MVSGLKTVTPTSNKKQIWGVAVALPHLVLMIEGRDALEAILVILMFGAKRHRKMKTVAAFAAPNPSNIPIGEKSSMTPISQKVKVLGAPHRSLH